MPRLDSYNVSAGEVIVRNRKQNLRDIWLKTNLFGLNWAKGDSARRFSKLTRSLPELGQPNECNRMLSTYAQLAHCLLRVALTDKG
jgi:hypothetical protein